MNQDVNFIDIEKEYNALVDSGEFNEAVRLTGEALAISDAQWTSLVNAHLPAVDALCASNRIGALHAEALFMAGAVDTCFSTSMLMLMRSGGSLTDSLQVQESVLNIPLYAILSLNKFMERCQASGALDDFLSDHATAIMILLASMLYSLYAKIGEADPAFTGLYDLRGSLSDMIAGDLVRKGDININGKVINSDDYLAIMGDVIGRARAIGLFVIE